MTARSAPKFLGGLHAADRAQPGFCLSGVGRQRSQRPGQGVLDTRGRCLGRHLRSDADGSGRLTGTGRGGVAGLFTCSHRGRVHPLTLLHGLVGSAGGVVGFDDECAAHHVHPACEPVLPWLGRGSSTVVVPKAANDLERRKSGKTTLAVQSELSCRSKPAAPASPLAMPMSVQDPLNASSEAHPDAVPGRPPLRRTLRGIG